MNEQDDQISDFFNQDPRISQWFRTNDSKAFLKSQGLQSSQDLNNHFDSRLDFNQENWNLQDFNRKAVRKQQNRQSSRRAREKKKQNMEKMKQRIIQLQKENQYLREKKICSWCKRSLEGMHQHYAQVCTDFKKNKESGSFNQQIVFEEIKDKKNQRRGLNAKLWIALGIMMLIIGLQLFGGSPEEKQIRIREKDVEQWAKKISVDGPDAISIKMKNKVKFLQNDKSTIKKQHWEQKSKWFERIHFQNDEQFYTEEKEDVEYSEMNIDKDLLFSIQAEFDDIGRYI